MRRCLVVTLLLLCGISPAFPDVVLLRDGQKLQGKVVAETYESITLKMKYGTVELYKSQVAKVQKKPLPAEVYRKKSAALAPGDAEAHYRLALWCREQELVEEYAAQLEQAIKTDPEHAAARKALGYVRREGVWVRQRVHLEPPSPTVSQALEIIAAALAAKPPSRDILVKELRNFDAMTKADFRQCARQIKRWRHFEPLPAGRKTMKFEESGLSCTVVVPEGYDGAKPVPVVLSLHGSARSSRDLTRAWSASRAAQKMKKECILVVPRSPSSRWWEPRLREKLDSLVDEIKETFNVDTSRFYLSGFENGAHGAFYYGLRRPDTFGAISPDSGLPLSTAADKVDYDSLANARNLPVFVVSAKEDPIAPGPRVAVVVRKLRSYGCTEVVHKEFPGPHKAHVFEAWGDAYDWFTSYTRNPYPGRVQIYFDGTGPRRAYWLELVGPEPGAKASAEIKGDRIEIKAKDTQKVVLYLSDELLDLDKRVTVRLNNKRVLRDWVERSAATALETCLKRNDRNFTYAAKLVFELK